MTAAAAVNLLHLYCPTFLEISTHLPLSSACANWTFLFATLFEPQTCSCYRYELPPPTYYICFSPSYDWFPHRWNTTWNMLLCADWSHYMQLRWFKLRWVTFPLHLLVACLEVFGFPSVHWLESFLYDCCTLWRLTNTPLLSGSLLSWWSTLSCPDWTEHAHTMFVSVILPKHTWSRLIRNREK